MVPPTFGGVRASEHRLPAIVMRLGVKAGRERNWGK